MGFRGSCEALALSWAILSFAPFANVACTRKLSLSVELSVPARPDPFEDVRTVRVRALVAGRIATVGDGRWDQGPIDLPSTIEPDVERLVVEGITAEGRLVSSGASEALDLLRSPPEGALAIFFSRVGVLSELATDGAFRFGGTAVELSDERVMFLGGQDDSSCAVETTEIAGTPNARAKSGPPLAQGRFGELTALALTDGRVVVVGGQSARGCGTTAIDRRVAVLDTVAGTARFGDVELPAVRHGAAAAAASDALMIVAGGDEEGRVLDDVYRFNPSTFELESPGNLGAPRSEAAAVPIAGRVVLAGGRSSIEDSSALANAVIFDPIRGAMSGLIDLLRPTIAPAAAPTLAGGVIIAGGHDAAGNALDAIDAVAVPSERAQTFGDTSTVAELAATGATGAGRLIDLEDGSFLFLPDDARAPLSWLSLLPRRTSQIDLFEGAEGPLIGGRTPDGTAVLRNETGRTLSFNPGVTSVLGTFETATLLASEGTALGRHSVGVIPLRPSSWSIDQGALRGALLPELPVGGVVAGEMAVLGRTSFADFDVRFKLELGSLSQASLLFAFEDGEYDQVVFLGGLTTITRSRNRAIDAPIVCEPAETPTLAQPGPHPLRVRRNGTEVRVDVGDDGSDEITCATPRPKRGAIAFGIIAGDAKLTALALEGAP